MATATTLPGGRSRIRVWRLVFFLLGLGLFFLLVRHVGLATLFQLIRSVGSTFLLLVVLYGGVHLLRTLSWRLCLGPECRHLALGPSLRLWIEGEAVAHMSFSWSGEAFRAAATRAHIPLPKGLSALVVSRGFYTYAGLLVMTASGLLCVFLLPLPASLLAPISMATLLLLAASLFPLLARTHARRFLLAGVASQPASSRVGSFLRSLREDMARVVSQEPGQFSRLMGLNLLAALAGVVEVYLILLALGGKVNLAVALVIEGVGKALALGAFLVPGNVGIREAGTVLVLRLFSLGAPLAVTLVLVRRARALVWVGVGCLLLLADGFGLGRQTAPGPQPDSNQEVAEGLSSSPKA